LNIFRTFPIVLILALVSGAALAADAPGIAVSQAWVRELPPTQANTAAYLVIDNQGGAAVSIVGASTDIAERVEFHTTREVDGYQRMEQLQQLELAPGQRLELAPGGTHLMLLELLRMPATGEQVQLCLHLGSGDQTCFSAEVRRDGGQSSHEHHHH
jgi:copper(I)-binding protein